MTTRGTNTVQKASGGRGVGSQVAIALSVAVVWAVLLLVLATGQGCSATPAAPSTAPLTWDDTIGPLLAKNCVVCHGGSSDLYLDTYENALKGGKRGREIVPGKSQDSRIVRALRGIEPGMPRMPLNRPPLSDAQISLIAAWIDAGAPQSATSGSAPASTATSVPATAAPPTSTFAPAATHTTTPAATPVPSTAQPTATIVPPTPTPTQPPAPTSTSAAPVGDPAAGAAFWQGAPCKGCHGDKAEGNLGPKLAGTSLTFAEVLKQVRTPRGVMPAFSASRVSDQDLRNVYAWLHTLP